MKTIVRAAVAAVMFVSFAGIASAQQQEAAPPQIALTDQQVQGFVSATPEITKITEKLQAEPDKKTQALKEVQPIKNQGNIALVEKNYDKIAPLMQE